MFFCKMKLNKLKTTCLLLFLVVNAGVFAQSPNLTIKQDAKLDSLIKLKIDVEKNRYESEYFTLQLYYGSLTVANETLEKFKTTFSHIPVDLSFETPNYKVQVGRYKDKIVALKMLDSVKKAFPAAFLLTRKELVLE